MQEKESKRKHEHLYFCRALEQERIRQCSCVLLASLLLVENVRGKNEKKKIMSRPEASNTVEEKQVMKFKRRDDKMQHARCAIMLMIPTYE